MNVRAALADAGLLRRATRFVLVASLSVGMLLFVVYSLHWQLMIDSPILHYANFQIAHGVAPYRELHENNLPGAYLSEQFGMTVFGAGDLAWRVFEFFELGICTLCMVYLAKPYDWVAGFFAGGVFTVMHAMEGPYFSGERELAMTAVILLGYAALFRALRSNAGGWLVPAFFFFSFAATIKPTVAPLPVLLLIAMVWLRRRDGKPVAPWMAWSIAGAACALGTSVVFLVAHQAFHAFIQTQLAITTYYSHVAALSLPHMLRRLFALRLYDELLILAVVLHLARRRQQPWTREQWLLAVGVGVGVLSYLVQRKDFLHHRYLYESLLLLLIGIELMQALRSQIAWQRWAVAAVALWIAFRFVPFGIAGIRHIAPQSNLTVQMEADLEKLGGTATLQRRVVCLDQVFGCLNALYHLRLVENAPLSGDMLLFAASNAPVIQSERAWFWRLQQTAPADVVVVTNENFLKTNDYSRLQQWPAYATLLGSGYTLMATRTFPCEAGRRLAGPDQFGYRVYVRNGSDLSAMHLDPQPEPSCH